MTKRSDKAVSTSASNAPRILVLLFGVVMLIIGAVVWLRSPKPVLSDAPKSDQQAETPWFEDVATSSGAAFVYASGHDGSKHYMPEIMGGGACWFDLEKDGDLDLYLVQGGRLVGQRDPSTSDRVYRNEGNGKFVDATNQVRQAETGYGMGCTTGDFDNDGWTDVYVANVGPNALYRNNGDGTLSDVTATARVGDAGFGAGSAFFDYDLDGDLDLFVTNYVAWSVQTELECPTSGGKMDFCKPTHYNAPSSSVLYRNEGNGTFTDVSESSGITSARGNGLGVVCSDFTGDGWPDIAVANDETPNHLFVNLGNGTFRNEAMQRGFAYNGQGLVEAGMGIDVHDADNDLDFDMISTHIEGELNTVYANEGGYFEDRTMRMGLASARPFTGFGVGVLDFNNDGSLDVYVVNGRVVVGFGEYYRVNPYAEPDQLWRGSPEGVFREVMPRGGTRTMLNDPGRGAAFADYDNDGRVDIAVINRDAPMYLLHNVTSGSHWIGFSVLNRHGSPAIGARLRVEFEGKTRLREVRTAYSYCSANDPRVHLGLGGATKVSKVEITWPDRSVQTLGEFAADQYVEIRQDSGKQN